MENCIEFKSQNFLETCCVGIFRYDEFSGYVETSPSLEHSGFVNISFLLKDFRLQNIHSSSSIRPVSNSFVFNFVKSHLESLGIDYLKVKWVKDFNKKFLPKKIKLNDNKPKVYFLKSGDYIKIGFSVDIRNRITELQTGSPDKLELLAFEYGGAERERYLHCKFKELHFRGEWFLNDGCLKKYVEKLGEYCEQFEKV